MEPASLIGPSSPLGSPAPYPLLVGLKVLGFTLHACFMNLWFVGVPLALALRASGQEHAGTLSARLMNPMPIVMALGINLGIVPLLFVQVTCYQAFYPATILMAWPWLSIIPLLTVAYYGIYAYAVGLRTGRMPGWRVAAGWLSAAFLVLIGFLFSNAFSLMTRLEAWPALLERTSVAGAPLGLALDLGDPSLLPRWLMFLALAATTTAVWILVDAAWFAGRESAEYLRRAARTSITVSAVGVLGFAAMGSWYVFKTWPPALGHAMFSGSLQFLTFATAVSPGVGLAVLVLAWRGGASRGLAVAAGLVQVVVLALNAVSRQVVQNLELARYLDVTAERVDPQWVPLALFLALFVAGLACVAWMVARAVRESRALEAESAG